MFVKQTEMKQKAWNFVKFSKKTLFQQERGRFYGRLRSKLQKESEGFFRSLRLSARTGDSHSSKRGSIPLGTK